MTDPDETPPAGLPTQDEIPTSPDLSAGLRCPSCLGQGMTLAIVERHPDGATAKALATTCTLCLGAKTVTRGQWRAWHATRVGRPPGF